MILIYCPEENPRVTWTLDLVFRQLMGVEYRLTTFREEIIQSDGARLNYSFSHIPGIPYIGASGLLFESDIRDQSARLIPGEPWAGIPVIFENNRETADLPFDILSAIFYNVTRYEEYLPFEPDEHHRFRSTESLAFHLGVLEKPVVNIWVMELAGLLKTWYGNGVATRLPEYTFTPTIDIDNAWAYAHKGLRRTLGGLWNDRDNMEARNFRFQVLRDNQADPYHTYELIHRFHSDAGVTAIWFFLVASYGLHDKNISCKNRYFRNLISKIAAANPTGLHPSYASGSLPGRLAQEAGRLQSITGQPVTRSRQHYLRLRLPDTYRQLVNLGITDDYSMGFADCAGFRAGISSPFRFFDLETNKSTGLTVWPFCVMDTGLRQYMKLNPGQAIAKIQALNTEVRRTNGTFISLWHNESLSEWNDWAGWSEVYRQLLTISKPT
jgi:hypothetical protein